MRIHFEPTGDKLEDVEFRVSMTAPLREWRRFLEILKATQAHNSHPASQIFDTIESLVEQAKQCRSGGTSD